MVWRCHIILLIVCIVLFGPFFRDMCSARSAEMKKPCVNCHTIHNSENANPVAVDPFGASTGPLEALMSATCTACHTGINNGTIDKPFVFQIANPGYDPTAGLTHTTLAGGSFYWVSQGFDLMGHNVVGVGATQVLGRQPPGDSTSTTFDFLTCAGTNGCHGDLSVASQVKAIWGGHHSPEESLSTDGSTLGRSYRLLLGISGVEDPNWEYSLAVGDHNQYFGNVRSGDDDLDTRTISHLCAKCHGDFHSGAGLAGVSADASFVSPWIRHPVDFDMGDAAGSEYTFYGGSGSYNVTTPLASDNIVLGVLSTVTLGGVGDGSAIITCITCHRAHGSPYDYSLRWDYKNWPGGALDGGCYDCHTVKI